MKFKGKADNKMVSMIANKLMASSTAAAATAKDTVKCFAPFLPLLMISIS